MHYKCMHSNVWLGHLQYLFQYPHRYIFDRAPWEHAGAYRNKNQESAFFLNTVSLNVYRLNKMLIITHNRYRRPLLTFIPSIVNKVIVLQQVFDPFFCWRC